MAKSTPGFIAAKLADRKESGSLRTLKVNTGLIDFCSNDYLGFASSRDLKSLIDEELKKYPDYLLGSTGSRLISGNDEFTEALEAQLAKFHKADAALIFNSGYDANVGLFSSLGQRGDTIITDELIHASIIDGARLSHANRYIFKHNDLNSLEEKLKASKGTIFIAVESIYSMDGDAAPLEAICKLAEKYNAYLIVDEAHATGIFGDKGQGLVHEAGLTDKVFARVVTFGKAIGTHGAIVLGDETLRSYLINFARSFVYSTAASFYTHLSTKVAYDYLMAGHHQSLIRNKIGLFQKETEGINSRFTNSSSTIHGMIIGGNEKTRAAAGSLQQQGFDVRPILSPTVAAGQERLRICLHTFNSDAEIVSLAESLKKL